MMSRMVTSPSSSPPNKPAYPKYIKEEREVKVTIKEVSHSSDIYHIVKMGIMMDHPTVKTSEEIT